MDFTVGKKIQGSFKGEYYASSDMSSPQKQGFQYRTLTFYRALIYKVEDFVVSSPQEETLEYCLICGHTLQSRTCALCGHIQKESEDAQHTIAIAGIRHVFSTQAEVPNQYAQWEEIALRNIELNITDHRILIHESNSSRGIIEGSFFGFVAEPSEIPHVDIPRIDAVDVRTMFILGGGVGALLMYNSHEWWTGLEMENPSTSKVLSPKDEANVSHWEILPHTLVLTNPKSHDKSL